MPLLKTKRNRVTAYGFACGHAETRTIGPYRAQLYKDGCYHVRCFHNDDGRQLWECFEELSAAREAFAKLCKWLREITRATT